MRNRDPGCHALGEHLATLLIRWIYLLKAHRTRHRTIPIVATPGTLEPDATHDNLGLQAIATSDLPKLQTGERRSLTRKIPQTLEEENDFGVLLQEQFVRGLFETPR